MKAHVPQQTGEAAAGAQGWGGSGAIPRRATAGTQQPGTPHGSTPGVGLPACSPGSVPHCKVFKCNFLIFLKGPQLLTCCVFFPSFFFSKAQHLISMHSSHCSPSWSALCWHPRPTQSTPGQEEGTVPTYSLLRENNLRLLCRSGKKKGGALLYRKQFQGQNLPLCFASSVAKSPLFIIIFSVTSAPQLL